MILIRRQDNVCTLVKGSPSRITKPLSFLDQNARFTPSFRDGNWDGRVLFYDWKARTFPTGLLPDVEAYLQSKKRAYKVKSKTREPISLDDFAPDCLAGVTLRDYQYDGAKAVIQAERGWLWDATNAGKAQPLYSTVYTPDGPVRMGDVAVGTFVLTPSGGTAQVLGVFPQGKRPTYRITFADGTSVDADRDHLWEVGCRRRDSFRLTTLELTKLSLSTLRRTWVPAVCPVAFRVRNVSIDPYVLGLLLGDGGLSGDSIKFSSADDSILRALDAGLPLGCSITHYEGYDYGVVGESGLGTFVSMIRGLGLLGKRSHEKFIPEQYRYNSVEVRYAVLQGILDTDGWVDRNGQPVLEQTSEQLARDVTEIVQSLGGTVLTSTKSCAGYKNQRGERVACKAVYRQTIRMPDARRCFRLSRKLRKVKVRKKPGHRVFRSIVPTASAECQCIYVDHPRHLYLTDGFVPTHNTEEAAAILLHLLRHTDGCALFLVPNAGLCIQTATRFRELIGSEYKIGAYGGGAKTIGDITVATAQSVLMGVPAYIEGLMRRTRGRSRRRINKSLNELLQRSNIVLVDEGHHASSDTWKYILGYSKARFRIGITGSFRDVHKGDGESVRDVALRAYVGPLVRRIKNSTLIKRGISARPIIYCISDAGVYAVDHTAKKFACDRHGRVRRDARGFPVLRPGNVRFTEEIQALLTDGHYNSAIVAIAESMTAGGFKTLILTNYVKHVKLLAAKFEKRGSVEPLSVWGDVAPPQRIKHIKRFSKRDDAVLIGSTVFDEGMNVPAIGCVIFASGGKSLRQLLQRIGRSLRRKKGDINMVVVVDMTATNGELLEKHTNARLDIYFDEGFTVRAVTDLSAFLKKAKRGWKGLLGKRRYVKERDRTRRLSEREAARSQKLGTQTTR